MRGARPRVRYALLAGLLVVAAALAFATGASAYSIWALAGDGTPCATPPSCGDGGTAPAARLGFPLGAALDSAGNVYIADWGDNVVRKLSVSGAITTVAGGGTTCSAPPRCGDGGPATDAQLSFPDAVAVDRAGNRYIADTGDNEVRKVSVQGRITRVAGNGTSCARPPACGDGGAATAGQLRAPAGVTVDASGNVYIADTGDNEIRKVTPSGKLSRVAGTGTPCSKPPACGDGGPATSAQLSFPGGVAVDRAGDVYIADDGDNDVRRLGASGTIGRVAGSGAQCSSPPSCGDGGAALSATLSAPDGVAVDRVGNVYVADTLDNEIRRVTVHGVIDRIAGNGAACSRPPACGNGGTATTAQLNYPVGVAVDPAGNVYVADSYDQELRWLSRARGSVLPTPAGTALLLAFGAEAGRGAVSVRYALGAAARVTLSVRPAAGTRVVVVAAVGREGFNQISWNGRIGGRPAGHGRYVLTISATIAGRSATSSASIRL